MQPLQSEVDRHFQIPVLLQKKNRSEDCQKCSWLRYGIFIYNLGSQKWPSSMRYDIRKPFLGGAINSSAGHSPCLSCFNKERTAIHGNASPKRKVFITLFTPLLIFHISVRSHGWLYLRVQGLRHSSQKNKGH